MGERCGLGVEERVKGLGVASDIAAVECECECEWVGWRPVRWAWAEVAARVRRGVGVVVRDEVGVGLG
ncbi:hypothetical protein EV192_112161 [Actinocrispum wychmicini]|uniref:Uncharacterized protein n=1 Tax=Actinocrispum wychmicini TaxID=1213861 RepID=A0A4R2J973_9PSEU|nr:hypothetical protein EV192_112161 [Actinocrispum wychmicini]